MCIFLFTYGKSQSAAKGFHALSKPEKHWVMMHPFIAKKAYRITEYARKVADSLQKAGVFTDGNGGQLDAFRHAFWMASLVQKISPRKARKLGQAHEKGNYLDWKNGKQEEGSRSDSLMCDMDLKNNESGIALGKLDRYVKPNANVLMSEVIAEIQKGNLVMMKKDESGNFYGCDGNMIDLAKYDGKWYVPKCEVKSNDAVKRR
jgi:hypothetical protein